jgi:hypothetical protein
MKFAIVDPKAKQVRLIDVSDAHNAYRRAGLDPMKVDHGMLTRDIGVVVQEYGFFVTPELQSYWAVGRHLYAGAAVLYAIDDQGRTINLAAGKLPSPLWLDAHDAEEMMRAGRIERPVIAVNGKVLWQWPAPRPREYAR